MNRVINSKKNILLLILLFVIFLAINTNWLWQLIYPIKYEDEVKMYSEMYDVDPFLVLSIIQVETKFNPIKVSKKGATGLMQIMPETAQWIIEKGNFPPEYMGDLQQPEINIELGSWYLSNIYHNYDKKVVVSIAAYNAGPGNVNNWLKKGVWDGRLEHLTQVPFGETRHYIQRVFYFYDRYQRIYEYGF